MSGLTEELHDLHDGYVEAVNIAVAENDLKRADRLAAAYDDEAMRLMGEWEGIDPCPVRRPTATPSGVRGLVRRLVTNRAA
jgi:hypothetical protein